MRARSRRALGAALPLLVLEVGAAGAWDSPPPRLDLTGSPLPAGEPLRGTVLGPPGHLFAVAASATDHAVVVHGIPLDLGPDAVVIAAGQLDGRGRARFTAPPPPGAEALHLQAVTSPEPGFRSLAVTPARTLRVVATPVAPRLLGPPEPVSLPRAATASAPPAGP
jgi:hypothetical protein